MPFALKFADDNTFDPGSCLRITGPGQVHVMTFYSYSDAVSCAIWVRMMFCRDIKVVPYDLPQESENG